MRIEKGVVVRDSIIMRHSTIGEGTQVNKAIIAENVHVGKHVVMGVGEEAPNVLKPNIYGFGLVTVGEKAVIPDGVTIGKNVCISGETSLEDYPDGTLPSGGAILKRISTPILTLTLINMPYILENPEQTLKLKK